MSLTAGGDRIGAGFDDVAKLTVYVVDWTPDKMGALVDGATRVAASKGTDIIRPITPNGVAALGEMSSASQVPVMIAWRSATWRSRVPVVLSSPRLPPTPMLDVHVAVHTMVASTGYDSPFGATDEECR